MLNNVFKMLQLLHLLLIIMIRNIIYSAMHLLNHNNITGKKENGRVFFVSFLT